VSSGYFCGRRREISEGDFWLSNGVGIRAKILFDKFVERSATRENVVDLKTFKQYSTQSFRRGFGEGCADAEALGNLGRRYRVNRITFAGRLDQFGLQNHFVAVLPAVFDAPGSNCVQAGKMISANICLWV